MYFCVVVVWDDISVTKVAGGGAVRQGVFACVCVHHDKRVYLIPALLAAWLQRTLLPVGELLLLGLLDRGKLLLLRAVQVQA